ncbi:hypothetical protein [Nocardia sp. NPDC051570]|uniref:hypothetical protein n=1 Tax=Nocardia sp. NPDC051570 TaxID=3364324 RepID=UPI0037B9F2B2
MTEDGQWWVDAGKGRKTSGQVDGLYPAMEAAEAVIDGWGLSGGFVIGPDGVNHTVVDESGIPPWEPTVVHAGWLFTREGWRAARLEADAEVSDR